MSSFRRRTLAVFARKPLDGVVFQPRIETWRRVNDYQGTTPDPYKGMSDLDLYDAIGCSCRPYHFLNPCLKAIEDPRVRLESGVRDGLHVARWVTPVGSIESHRRSTALAWHTDKFPVETPEDARVMEYILRGLDYEWDDALFSERDLLLGDRAAPMIYVPRVNLMRMYIEIMGVENTMYAMADDLPMVERLITAIDEADARVTEVVARCPVEIINFGDNVDQHLLPPNLLERYVMPEYQRRSEVLHGSGKYTFAHWDGSAKLLLPYARRTGMDGMEALTPIPQGDVTIQEIKDALGDMVMVDGIPMTWFLPHEKDEDLERVTRETIELFHPNLILGISDELSPVCDIEKVRLVARIVKEYEK